MEEAKRASAKKMKSRPTREELADAENELAEMNLAKTGGRKPEQIGDDDADVF